MMRYVKRPSTLLVITEMKRDTIMSYHLLAMTTTRKPKTNRKPTKIKSKILKITIISKNVEKLEFFCILVGPKNCATATEDNLFLKKFFKNITTCDPPISLLGIY
jgi:hypothetical protein